MSGTGSTGGRLCNLCRVFGFIYTAASCDDDDDDNDVPTVSETPSRSLVELMFNNGQVNFLCLAELCIVSLEITLKHDGQGSSSRLYKCSRGRPGMGHSRA